MRGYLGLLLSVMLIFEACIARMPSPQAPRATASLPPMSIFYTPTSIPTLGGETTWQEPLAQRSVILERPSPSGGIDYIGFPRMAVPPSASPIYQRKCSRPRPPRMADGWPFKFVLTRAWGETFSTCSPSSTCASTRLFKTAGSPHWPGRPPGMRWPSRNGRTVLCRLCSTI